jgi:hypothetical protein
MGRDLIQQTTHLYVKNQQLFWGNVLLHPVDPSTVLPDGVLLIAYVFEVVEVALVKHCVDINTNL